MAHDLRFIIYSAKDDGPHAPEGPGWYLVATRKGDGVDVYTDEVVPHVRLTADEMEKLGQVFDNFVKGKPQNWNPNPTFRRTDTTVRNAVREANQEVQEAIEAQIEYLKSAALTLEMLRARAAEFDTAQDS
jgi:hypothetical protein